MAAMDLVLLLVDFILHVDRYLENFVTNYGAWVYALLFLIIFVETGVVVMPFLPGDSLLFVVGALCGVGLMNYPLSVGLLIAAAVIGNQSNYTIGRYFGPRVQMTRRKFSLYDVTGGTLWVGGVITAGYFFGSMPWVKENLDKIIWAMILIPGLIVLVGAWQARRKGKAAAQA
jgi:membrane-associated protein